MQSIVWMGQLKLMPLRQRGFISFLSCRILLVFVYILMGFSNYRIDFKDPCTTQAKLSTFRFFIRAVCLLSAPQKRIILGENMFNGVMTAQWNGKLRNAK